jgi:hypothetical protein
MQLRRSREEQKGFIVHMYITQTFSRCPTVLSVIDVQRGLVSRTPLMRAKRLVIRDTWLCVAQSSKRARL